MMRQREKINEFLGGQMAANRVLPTVLSPFYPMV